MTSPEKDATLTIDSSDHLDIAHKASSNTPSTAHASLLFPSSSPPSSSSSSSSSSPAPPVTTAKETSTSNAPTKAPVVGIAGDNSPPDGGLQAWLQVVGSFFLFFNSWGNVNSFGVFQTYYQVDLLHTSSPSTISWIGSIQAFLLLVVGVVSGPLYDAGYFRTLISCGTFCLVFGLMMTSLATQYWQIMLAQGILVGLGNGCLFTPSVAILPQYFSRKRALANGLAATGSSLSGIIYPLAFRALQVRVGFPWATRVLAFIQLGTLSISLAVMRVRILPQAKRKIWDWTAFRETPYTLFCAGLFAAFIGLYPMMFYVQTYAIETHALSETSAFNLLPVLNAASVFGRILPNLIADHAGPFNLLIPAIFVSGLLAFCWIAAHSGVSLFVIAALFGFSSGAFVSLPPIAIVTLTPSMRVLGTRMGMAFATASFGLLIGTPVAGVILHDTRRWAGLQAFAAVFVVFGGVLLCVARTVKYGFVLRVKA